MSLCHCNPQNLTVHFLEHHQILLYANPQGPFFKPQASLLSHQPQLLPLLPLNSKFPSYKLVSHAKVIRFPLDTGLNCLTESISGLIVTQGPKEQNVMIASTFKQNISSFGLEDDIPEYSFPDLSLRRFSHHYTNLPSCSQAVSKLSALPPWKLDTAVPLDGEVSIGYNVFVVRNS
ncbi:hypothetical protein EI94DRAFT_590374 [Lactarius quietus]|nr:hypothetical protein EI94DRAFT_590374 [Lactarius quietus]